MDDDFDEFCEQVGRDVPVFRGCEECGGLYIVDPVAYDKSKTVCDPGYCEHYIPYCICKDKSLSENQLANCKYPNCPKTSAYKDELFG